LRDLRKKNEEIKEGKSAIPFQLSEHKAADESINNLSSRKTYYDPLFMRKSQTERKQDKKGKEKERCSTTVEFSNWGPQGPSRGSWKSFEGKKCKN